MPFQFSLETVLNLRRSLEDAERLRLQNLLLQRAELERRLTATTSAETALRAALLAAMGDRVPVPGVEIRFAGQRLEACARQALRLERQVTGLDQQILRQQAVLLQHRTRRQLLEQLRNQYWSRYEREVERRTQSQVEELFLLRRWRPGNETPAPGR